MSRPTSAAVSDSSGDHMFAPSPTVLPSIPVSPAPSANPVTQPSLSAQPKVATNADRKMNGHVRQDNRQNIVIIDVDTCIAGTQHLHVPLTIIKADSKSLVRLLDSATWSADRGKVPPELLFALRAPKSVQQALDMMDDGADSHPPLIELDRVYG